MLATPSPQPVADPVSRWNDWPQNSAAAQQFFDRLFPAPTRAQEVVYGTLIDALVAAGVWYKLDCLYLFAAPSEDYALTNLIQDNFRAYRDEPAGNVTWTANSGYSGGGVNRHVNSGFNPTTATAPNFSRNDSMHGAWCGDSAQNAAEFIQTGVGATQLFGNSLYTRFTDNLAYARANSATSMSGASTDGSGLFIAQRTTSNAQQIYRNGSQIASGTQASIAIQNSSLYFFCAQTTRIGVLGKSLSGAEHTSLHAACAAFLTSVVVSLP